MKLDRQISRDATKQSFDENSGILDQRFYYYQTKDGATSKAPLPLRRLVRLFCPVREGLNPILPSTTQCLAVLPHAQQNQREDLYGEWKAASEIDILREASCINWFWTIEGRPADGPSSCRKLLEVILKHGDINSSKVMVYAKDITTKWTMVSAMASIQLVLTALQDKKRDDSKTAEKDNKQTSSADPTENVSESYDGKERSPHSDDDIIQNELEAFLSSSTKNIGTENTKANKEEIDDDHVYESEGNRYLKDPLTGHWIHEALAPKDVSSKGSKKSAVSQSLITKTKVSSKKSKKAKFSKRNAKLWIYISGLPTEGVTVEDIQKYFSKAGLLDLDPETLRPKIKLYKDSSTGKLKGDASICYARSESVELALQILDNSLWDKDHRITLERAKFQAKAEFGKNLPNGACNIHGGVKRKSHVSEAQRKVARLAILQAQDEGFGGRLSGGRKGLCIIVVKNIMEGIPEENLEATLYESLQKYGPIEKITCISKTRVVIVKYVEPIAASTAIQGLNGSPNARTREKIEAIYWDGVTDHTTVVGDEEKEREEEERRHEEFGSWLESQEELPPELQLQVAQD
mmetsp:Transcript_23105/g.54616  ORF Transcript_23105/g.54616 Transcript_23105/m.54616 type:complete len:577 (-) Transcript_23105:269-1999(-)|eukprot:CAMPEP_0197188908 /NCGR_PEP_ID=MMETSP1423-20130617/18743_1 /TAXON_ID=476441 /ORGANISM="Pseudo-nitzschia heimii, Strain UNC1101" /LENGTH=576 /DNA_ID=CAMNT_0042640891 /DNA_START=98 /DNA_END=1828 /DNA_ORIENTATION=+